MAHDSEMTESPRTRTLTVKTTRAPYRSISHPTAGDAKEDTSPPRLAAPAMSVRLQPRSSASGNMKTARVRLAAAFRTNCELPAENRITHP